MNLLPHWPHLSAFLLASVVLAVTPGPGVAYILARSLVQGRAAGLASVLGVAVGNFCNALAAAMGLAALFAVSSLAFTLVKWAGAIYLMGLGLHMLWQARKAQYSTYGANSASAPTVLQPVPRRTLIRDGFLVSLLNPKTTIFFAAFLPQFMREDVSRLSQGVLLGAVFVGIAALTDCVYALLASSLSARLTRSGPDVGRWGKFALGSTFIGMGVMTAITNGKAK
jgi:threonine/homoserine/homoserine lactone efflux protein